MGNMLLLYILSCTVPYLESGALSAGDVTSLLLYGTFSGAALASLASFYASMNKAIGASERIYTLLDSSPNKIGGSLRPQSGAIGGHVTFSNVSFNYPSRPESNILKNISIDIPANSTCAIVGGSGSGKSTIAKLLFGFYKADTGKIEIDSQNIQTLDYDWTRSNMSMVPQDPQLFSDTVRSNISYGANDPSQVSDDDIVEVAKKANAWGFIEELRCSEYFNGLDAPIGESGVLLSGGQKQRLVIARALLRKPSILVLDEATSALDAESEALVQAAIETLSSESVTMIIIAHRLSTVKNADKIIVLDEGNVSGQGTFDELLETNTIFHDFVKRQSLS